MPRPPKPGGQSKNDKPDQTSQSNSQPSRHKLTDAFTFHKAFKYNKRELQAFLCKACNGKSHALTEKEKEDLLAIWKEILEPYL